MHYLIAHVRNAAGGGIAVREAGPRVVPDTEGVIHDVKVDEVKKVDVEAAVTVRHRGSEEGARREQGGGSKISLSK